MIASSVARPARFVAYDAGVEGYSHLGESSHRRSQIVRIRFGSETSPREQRTAFTMSRISQPPLGAAGQVAHPGGRRAPVVRFLTGSVDLCVSQSWVGAIPERQTHASVTDPPPTAAPFGGSRSGRLSRHARAGAVSPGRGQRHRPRCRGSTGSGRGPTRMRVRWLDQASAARMPWSRPAGRRSSGLRGITARRESALRTTRPRICSILRMARQQQSE